MISHRTVNEMHKMIVFHSMMYCVLYAILDSCCCQAFIVFFACVIKKHNLFHQTNLLIYHFSHHYQTLTEYISEQCTCLSYYGPFQSNR